jgi:tryptophanyl-tRNA synthetase
MKSLTGIRPTGRVHIGHYFSVIQPAIKYNCNVLVADYHAENPQTQYTVDVLNRYGINPIIQSDIFNAELYFKLLNVSKFSDLKKMTQFKSTENQSGHMLVYPVLMAHDLAGYDEVYIGDDQKQHIELAKKLLSKLDLKCPQPLVVGNRIMDLRNPENKMSSSKPESCLFLDEDPTKKIMKAITNEDGLENLRMIYKKLIDEDYPEKNIDLKIELIDKIKEIQKPLN